MTDKRILVIFLIQTLSAGWKLNITTEKSEIFPRFYIVTGRLIIKLKKIETEGKSEKNYASGMW